MRITVCDRYQNDLHCDLDKMTEKQLTTEQLVKLMQWKLMVIYVVSMCHVLFIIRFMIPGILSISSSCSEGKVQAATSGFGRKQ